MKRYEPSMPFNVPAFLMSPTVKNVKGVSVKTFEKSEKPFFCSFKTFGGTERESNGITVVENTAVIETWFNPELTADKYICVADVEYEILGTPENINMQNQFMKFKVRAVKGGA